MSKKVYTMTALTGGATGALDALDGNDLNDGDMAIVTVSGAVYIYVLDHDNSSAESSPGIISPDKNYGTKRWILQGPTRSKLISTTHDVSVTGAQAITGAGFQPSGGVILVTIDNTLTASWGLFDSTPTLGSLSANRNATEDTFEPYTRMTLYTGVGVWAGITIASLDTDGLTLTWTKAGSPTGTATIKLLLFR